MAFSVALAPEVGLDPAELAAAWNGDAQARALGRAAATPAVRGSFLDPAAANVIIGAMVGVSAQVLASALYDFLKQKFGRETAVQVVERPDQPPIIVVVLVEAD